MQDGGKKGPAAERLQRNRPGAAGKLDVRPCPARARVLGAPSLDEDEYRVGRMTPQRGRGLPGVAPKVPLLEGRESQTGLNRGGHPSGARGVNAGESGGDKH